MKCQYFSVLLHLSIIIALAGASAAIDSPDKVQRRNSKLFPFLAVVSFPNSKCTDTTTMTDGLCYTSSQCTRNGGMVSASSCAQNYGVCCLFKQSCGGTPPTLTVRNNLTQLIGAVNTPTAVTQPCQIKIPKQPGVCQLRLDFTTFTVGTADGAGNCPDDSVSFKSDNLPDGLTLCGVATGQHLYLHYGQLDTININTNLISAGSMYDIKVTMIKCDSTEQAPAGCTQYYTAPTAEVMSFNFNMQQLNSEMYTVCVKSTGGQTITWSPCTSIGNNVFSISGIGNGPPTSVIGDKCMTDYIFIPPGNKICGTSFASTFATRISPFFLMVNFDGSEVPIPQGPNDPITGCPPMWTCNTPPGGPCLPGGTCQAPGFYFTEGLVDVANLGFCLKYSVTA